ncbi:LCP family protein [Streptomyces sp. NPDC008001]|uniref:LCP family protein n=1 Tax=Streptomyces sp. NPDC008001 TaxID=3364804 RepID=UPI0036E8D850
MRQSRVRGPQARESVPGAREKDGAGAAEKTAKDAGKDTGPEAGQDGKSGKAGESGKAAKSGQDATAGQDGRAGEGSGAGAPPGRRARAARIARWAALCLAVLVLGTSAAGYFYYQHLNGNLKKDLLNLGDKRLDRSAANAEGQRPLNILLLGSDSRNTAENVALGGAREDAGRKPLADVQMLVHVSADRSNMSVISVPRDTRVTIPKCTDPDDGTVYKETNRQIINTSLMNGGPGCTVAAWEELTGIPIDHFMMIDFSGVVNMADAVGGVPVCVDNNVYDKLSGLRLEKGTHNVKGQQALQWLRTRHGFEDGSDIGRTHAQHMYMNAMVRQLKSGTKLTDPDKLTDLAEAATKALTVDKDLGSVKKLYDLADDIKRVPSDRITMTTMPWASDPWDPDAHVIPKPGDAEKLFSLVRSDIALDGKDKKKDDKGAAPSVPASPKGSIAVTVFNGTGTATQPVVTGRGAEIAAALVKQGFTKAISDSSPRAQADTTLSYAKTSQRADAQALAKALGLPERAVRMSTAVDGLTLVIGGDWRAGTTYPKGDDASGDDKGTKPATGEKTGTGDKSGAGEKSAAGEKTGKPGDDDRTQGTQGDDKPKKEADNKAPESADPLNGSDTSACMKVNSLNRF